MAGNHIVRLTNSAMPGTSQTTSPRTQIVDPKGSRLERGLKSPTSLPPTVDASGIQGLFPSDWPEWQARAQPRLDITRQTLQPTSRTGLTPSGEQMDGPAHAVSISPQFSVISPTSPAQGPLAENELLSSAPPAATALVRHFQSSAESAGVQTSLLDGLLRIPAKPERPMTRAVDGSHYVSEPPKFPGDYWDPARCGGHSTMHVTTNLWAPVLKSFAELNPGCNRLLSATSQKELDEQFASMATVLGEITAFRVFEACYRALQAHRRRERQWRICVESALIGLEKTLRVQFRKHCRQKHCGAGLKCRYTGAGDLGFYWSLSRDPGDRADTPPIHPPLDGWGPSRSEPSVCGELFADITTGWARIEMWVRGRCDCV